MNMYDREEFGAVLTGAHGWVLLVLKECDPKGVDGAGWPVGAEPQLSCYLRTYLVSTNIILGKAGEGKGVRKAKHASLPVLTDFDDYDRLWCGWVA